MIAKLTELAEIAEKLYTEWWMHAVGVPTWDELDLRGRDAWARIAETAIAEVRKIPIPIRLTCEGCGELHVDEGWPGAVSPHATHVCQNCGLAWKPSLVPTIGVRFLPGHKNEAKPDAEILGQAAGVEKATAELAELAAVHSRLICDDDLSSDQPVKMICGCSPGAHPPIENMLRGAADREGSTCELGWSTGA
jgi:hypothetical protein